MNNIDTHAGYVHKTAGKGYKIKSHSHYIEIMVDAALVKQTILSLATVLQNHPDYYKKHSLWNLSSSRIECSIHDLKEVIDILGVLGPKKNSLSKKTILLVSGILTVSMAKFFVEMAKALPYNWEVVSDAKAARVFLGSELLQTV